MGDVLGLAEIADRDVALDEGAARFLGGMQLLEDLLAVDAAGLDGVDRHAVGGDIAGQALGPEMQGGLGGDGGIEAARLHGAADVDDAAPAALRACRAAGPSSARRAEVKLSANASSQKSSPASTVVGREPPAQLTRMSTWPRAVVASRARRARSSAEVMSAAIGVTLRCRSILSTRRAVAATRTPCSARRRTIPAPMPALAPVTRQVRSLSSKSIGL